jgi:hypothetical protein
MDFGLDALDNYYGFLYILMDFNFMDHITINLYVNIENGRFRKFVFVISKMRQACRLSKDFDV